MSVYTYGLWEDYGVEGTPEIELGGLEPYEHYLVLRKRSGYGIGEIARRMGTPRDYIYRMETGQVKCLNRLMDFWGV